MYVGMEGWAQSRAPTFLPDEKDIRFLFASKLSPYTLVLARSLALSSLHLYCSTDTHSSLTLNVCRKVLYMLRENHLAQ
jgi:hypothetical protein